MALNESEANDVLAEVIGEDKHEFSSIQELWDATRNVRLFPYILTHALCFVGTFARWRRFLLLRS
jgi:hypothetical protein